MNRNFLAHLGAAPQLLKLARHILQSNVGELSHPYRLTYAVTDRCQAGCLMCNIWQRPPREELTLSEIDAIFARANRFSWINLTGGEIFLRPDIVAVVRSICRHNRGLYLLNFTTNGYLTEAIVAAVGEMLALPGPPRLMVTVSLDGPRELHDRIRNLPGSFDRALATFDGLRSLGSPRLSVYLGFTLQEANLDSFDATLAAVEAELGTIAPEEFHLNLAQLSGHYYDNEGFTGLPEPGRACELLASHLGARQGGLDPVSYLERRYRTLAERYLTEGRVPLPCQGAGASCFLDATGTLYPCTMFDAPVGSLREHDYDLYRLWAGTERLLVRTLCLKGECPGCWTPCEAYQSILADLGPGSGGFRRLGGGAFGPAREDAERICGRAAQFLPTDDSASDRIVAESGDPLDPADRH